MTQPMFPNGLKKTKPSYEPNGLAHDMSRCVDDKCSMKEKCLRWVSRNDVGPRIPYCATFRSIGETGRDCTFRIPLRTTKKIKTKRKSK